MTVPAPWTAIHRSPQSSPRQNVARRGVIVHHQAGTNFAHLRQLVLGQAGRIVSYTAIASGQQLELIVPDDARRPWSVGDAHWDSAMRSVCLTNTTLGPGWAVADATVWAAARAIAFWAQRDGFRPHRDGDPRTWTVLGHGEIRPIHGGSHPTACPGGVPLNLITARAQALLTDPLEDDMLIIASPNRTPTLIGPGYARELNTPEEIAQANGIATRRDGNDRQFDLWRSLATTGRATPPPVTGPAPTVDPAALVAEMRRQGLTVAVITQGGAVPVLEVDDATHLANDDPEEQP